MSMSEKKFLAAIGKKVKALRKAKGLSQYAFSDESGVSRSQISRLEDGDLNCTMTTLLALAQALDVEPKELINF